MNSKGAINALLLSIFGTALVTSLVFPNRQVDVAIRSFFSVLANSIRATLGTKDSTKPKGPATGIQGLADKINGFGT